MNHSHHNSSQPRWWPAWVVLVGGLLALLFVWLLGGEHQQGRVLNTAKVILTCGALLLLWVLFFSRFRWTTRLLAQAVVAGSVVLLAVTVRITGVTGDMVPVLEWRWAVPSEASAGNQVVDKPLPGYSFPQFLGPGRNCVVEGPKLARNWTANSPEQLWRQSIGAAWSGFAIQGRRAVTQEQQDEQEMVVCYDLLTGATFWSHGDEAHYNTTIAGEGPRATPSIAVGMVFSLGATGILNCRQLEDGKLLWRRNIVVDAGIDLKDGRNRANGWGYAGSPLVVEGKVVVSAGGTDEGSLLAYDLETGEPVWRGGNASAGYSSPIAGSFFNSSQVLIFNSDGLAAHATGTGKVLWQFPWNPRDPHVSVPLQLPGNRVLASLGYGHGSKLLEVVMHDGQFSASEQWHSRRMKAKFTNLVHLDGFIYGLDDGMFSCIDVATGKRQWKEGRYGHGQVLLCNGVLLVMAENGKVVMLNATPRNHQELGRFPALDGKCWNPPALAGEYLLVRNHREAACYRLPLEKDVLGQVSTSTATP